MLKRRRKLAHALGDVLGEQGVGDHRRAVRPRRRHLGDVRKAHPPMPTTGSGLSATTRRKASSPSTGACTTFVVVPNSGPTPT